MKHFKSTIPSSEITPESVYLSRRALIKAGVFGLGATALSGCAAATIKPTTPAPTAKIETQAAGATAPVPTSGPAKAQVDELGDPLNAYDEIINYNNFYEFTTEKRVWQQLPQDSKPHPGP